MRAAVVLLLALVACDPASPIDAGVDAGLPDVPACDDVPCTPDPTYCDTEGCCVCFNDVGATPCVLDGGSCDCARGYCDDEEPSSHVYGTWLVDFNRSICAYDLPPRASVRFRVHRLAHLEVLSGAAERESVSLDNEQYGQVRWVDTQTQAELIIPISNELAPVADVTYRRMLPTGWCEVTDFQSLEFHPDDGPMISRFED